MNQIMYASWREFLSETRDEAVLRGVDVNCKLIATIVFNTFERNFAAAETCGSRTR